jgi:hypothetical protein
MQVLKLVNLMVHVCSTLAQLNRFGAQALAVICEKAMTCKPKMMAMGKNVMISMVKKVC